MTALTVFRLIDGLDDDGKIILDRDKLLTGSVHVSGKLLGHLYVKPIPSHPPGWLKWFEGSVDLEGRNFSNSSVSAVLVVRDAGRVFAVTFGYGRALLNQDSVQTRFGLRATLNAIEPDQIRAIDHTRVDEITRHTKEQLARTSSIRFFGLDVDRDMLRGVTAKPRDPSLGTQLSGGTSLTIHGAPRIAGLRAALRRYAILSEEITYKEAFPWVDHIEPVLDQALVAALDKKVVALANGRHAEELSFSPPEIIDRETVAGFRYSKGRDVTLRSNLDFKDYRAERFPSAKIDLNQLKKDRVFEIADDECTERRLWSVYKCLSAQISLGGQEYVLSEGAWFRVEADFRLGVQREISQIGRTGYLLPEFKQKTEANYNKKVSEDSSGNFINLDLKKFSTGARTVIEACDLFGRAGAFLHVKRADSSKTLSHLFFQGIVSAQFFANDSAYRSAILEELPVSHHWDEKTFKPTGGAFEVAYVVIGHWSSPTALPFFSQVSLRNAARTLSQIGYRVTYTSVPDSRSTQ